MPQSPSCSSPPTGSTTYGFNADGERTGVTSASSSSTYNWNAYGQLTSTSTGSSSVGYTYNAAGLLAMRLQGGSTANLVWDPVGSANPLLVDDGTNYYIYGPDGSPTEQVGVSSGTVDYYLHDQLGSTRLLTSSSGAVAGSWTYNAWGQTVATGGGSGGSGLTISRVGNLATGTGTTLADDPQATGDLMVLTVTTNNSTPPTVSSVSGGGVASWSLDKRLTDTEGSGYDAEIWSGVVTATGQSTITITVGGYSNGNDLSAQELSAGAGATWDVASSGALASQGTPWDYPALSATASTELYYGFAVTNNNSWNTLEGGGTTGFTYVSGPGGDLIAYGTGAPGTLQPTGTDNGGSDQDAVAIMVSASGTGGPSATTPLLWAGQYQDPTTGLYYMRARWYDPSTGEFLSVDPDFNQTLDAYGYADENPVVASDPSGLCVTNSFNFRTCPSTTPAPSPNPPVTSFTAPTKTTVQLPAPGVRPGTGGDAEPECDYEDCGAPAEGFVDATEDGDISTRQLYSDDPETEMEDVSIMEEEQQEDEGLITPELEQLATQNMSDNNLAVIGPYQGTASYPSYIEKAQALGASYFDIGDEWDKLSAEQQTAVNQYFLDQVADDGDSVLLSQPKGDIRVNSATWDETQYLTNARGYVWVNQWKLVPGQVALSGGG
jgi:RHS repeat-associated protein